MLSFSQFRPVSRWCAIASLALLGAARAISADAPEAPPIEAPVAVEAEKSTPPRRVERGTIVKFFEDAELAPNDVAENVVALFADVRAEGHVRGNAVAIFGTVQTGRDVNGNAVAIGGDATIAGEVDGNAVSIFGDLSLASDVRVHGNAVAVGGRIHRDDSVEVDGNEVPLAIPGLRHFGTWLRECLIYGRLYPHNAVGTWVFVGVMLALSLLLAAMFRGPVQASVSVLERRPGMALINGVLTAFLTPPALVVLVSTVIGILVVPFLWVGLVFATWIGVIAVSLFCGSQLGLGKIPALALVVGHVVFAALYAIPVIGLLTWMGVMTLGIGAAVTAWGESRRREKANHVSPPRRDTAPITPAPVTSTATASAVPFAATSSPATAASPATGLSGSVTPDSVAGFVSPPTADANATPPPMASSATASMPTAATATSNPFDAVTPLSPAIIATLERATFGPRLVATLLDLLFVGAGMAFLHLGGFFGILWFGYHIAFWTWRGTTLGGIVMNLRLVRIDGGKLDVGVAVVRALGAVLSFVCFGLGFFQVNWDPERQSWHDKIAGTVIVRVPRGQPLL